MDNLLKLIGRDKALFTEDINALEKELSAIVGSSKFLVLGGAGSIGQAVTKEIFRRKPLKLHVVDLSENNLAELVRDIRNSFGYIDGDFRVFALDIGSKLYDAFFEKDGDYDYILNLSALKHVRSEKDAYTLMRMVETNIFNTDKTLSQAIDKGVKKYFCVSTDKAANPVNMMGASKRIMEMFVHKHSENINVSMARFANVAFSDGSLLHSFNQRIAKRQALAAPSDIRRYFVTPKESGELCLLSCIFGENRDIFFPKLSENLHLITFKEIAEKYLESLGYQPYYCKDEEEARSLSAILPSEKQWALLATISDTTGEKDFEEFYTASEILDMERFYNLGVIKKELDFDADKLKQFEQKIKDYQTDLTWTKEDIIREFFVLLPDFQHKETGKYLDGKM